MYRDLLSPRVTVRAVAFDLDDTLAVTVRDRETLLREAVERAGVPVDLDREDYVEAHRDHSGSATRRPVFEALVDDLDHVGDADAVEPEGNDDDLAESTYLAGEPPTRCGSDDDAAGAEAAFSAEEGSGLAPGNADGQTSTNATGGKTAADRAGATATPDRSDRKPDEAVDAATSADAADAAPAGGADVADAADAAALTRAYREAVGGALEPVAGAGSLVEELRGRYRVGLLTDGPDDAQHDKLRRLGWTDAFDAVVVTGGIAAPKPDPVAFHALAAALDVSPAETVYVGDNPQRDVAGAAAAGMLPLQVLYDGGPEPHPAAVATLRRTDLESLPGVIENLGCDRPDDA